MRNPRALWKPESAELLLLVATTHSCMDPHHHRSLWQAGSWPSGVPIGHWQIKADLVFFLFKKKKKKKGNRHTIKQHCAWEKNKQTLNYVNIYNGYNNTTAQPTRGETRWLRQTTPAAHCPASLGLVRHYKSQTVVMENQGCHLTLNNLPRIFWVGSPSLTGRQLISVT